MSYCDWPPSPPRGPCLGSINWGQDLKENQTGMQPTWLVGKELCSEEGGCKTMDSHWIPSISMFLPIQIIPANCHLLSCAIIPFPMGCNSKSFSLPRLTSKSHSGLQVQNLQDENLFFLWYFLRFSHVFLMICRYRTAWIGEDLLHILLSVRWVLSVQGFWQISPYYLSGLFHHLLLFWNLLSDGASQTLFHV